MSKVIAIGVAFATSLNLGTNLLKNCKFENNLMLPIIIRAFTENLNLEEELRIILGNVVACDHYKMIELCSTAELQVINILIPLPVFRKVHCNLTNVNNSKLNSHRTLCRMVTYHSNSVDVLCR